MQMKHLLLLASLLTFMGAGAQQATFRNPVIAGDMADPTVIRVGNTYYATGTSSEWAPYYPLFRSKDLVNWQQIGHLFEQQPAWTRSSFWAPELFHRNGKTYAYYTARRKTDGTSYIGVATADKPEGPYTDHGPIVEYGTEAIDAFVLEDAGELYISWKAYGLDQRPIELLACKISNDGLRMAGEPFTLLRDDKRQGMEGQHWLKIGDYYYIVYSINGCCGPGSDYAVAVARSKNLRGPYERYAGNPILHGGGDVQSIGHGTVTTTPDGRMFYLCHAYLAGENFFLGRQPMLQEIVLGDDLWLHFTGGETASLTQPMPFAGMAQQPVFDFADDFTADRLRPEWTWNYPYATPEIELADGRALPGRPAQRGRENRHGALPEGRRRPDYTLETALSDRNAGWSGLTVYGDAANLRVSGIVMQGDEVLLKLYKDGRETLLGSSGQIGSHLPVYLRIEVRGRCPRSIRVQHRRTHLETSGEPARRCRRPAAMGSRSTPGIVLPGAGRPGGRIRIHADDQPLREIAAPFRKASPLRKHGRIPAGTFR